MFWFGKRVVELRIDTDEGIHGIGQVSSGSTVSAQTITLASVDDVANFEVGMTLRGTSTDGGVYDTGDSAHKFCFL